MKKYLISLSILMITTCHLFAQTKNEGNYFTSFDSTKIYYEVNGEGFPFILIHGFSGTGQGWKHCAVYNDLLKAGYKVILTGNLINHITNWLMQMMPRQKI